MLHRALVLAVTASLFTSFEAVAQPQAESSPPPSKVVDHGQRVLGTADQPVPQTYLLYEDGDVGAFIKPVVQMAAVVVHYRPDRDLDDDTLSQRTSTLLLARLGLEGRLTDWIHFRSVFERNIGYSLARNGPVGTSIWEGTGSFQARENYIRLQRWGLSLTGGIVPDPASIDFIADTTLDFFGMDPYVRDPLLVTGFNQGQGFLLRYSRWGFTAGMGVSAGNPLVSSLSFGFGGQVSALGTLFSAPLRALANGIPGSDIHMVVYGPSLSFESKHFDVRLAAQFYDIDIDLSNDEDARLSGWNLRSTAQAKFFGDVLRVFWSHAHRANDQNAIPDVTTRLGKKFIGLTYAFGAQINLGDFSIGGQRYWNRSEATEGNALKTTWVTVGAHYWLWARNVSAGVRWAFSDVDTDGVTVTDLKTHSVNFSLRLMI